MQRTALPRYAFNGDEFYVAGKTESEHRILKIVSDDYPDSPREWSNAGTMVCFHKRYGLGDDHDFSDPEDFLNSLVRERVPVKKLLKAVRSGRTNLTLAYDRSDRVWKLSGPCYWRTVLGSTAPDVEVICEYDCTAKELDVFYDAIIEELSMSSMRALLDEFGELEMLPLYLYDHSGITMSTRPFSCSWDSGQVGWIYVTKEKVFEEKMGWIDPALRASNDPQILNDTANWEFPNEENWRKIAAYNLESEVETYDDYLTGNVFGYQLFEVCDDCGSRIEIDSCYGFYSSSPARSGILDGFTVLEAV